MVELDFSDISIESKGACYGGKLKFSDGEITFKNSKTGKSEHISTADIDLVNWVRTIGKLGLRIFLKNGSLIRFFGFKDAERDKLELTKYFKENDLELQQKDMSLIGWNWGTAKFIGSVLSFDVKDNTAFDIALSNVSQCTTGKNEITLEFHQNDDVPIGLMEMRFHIPSSELAGDSDPVEAFHNQVVQGARVMSVTGDAIAIFREIHCLTPRGRYDIKVFQSFFQLHGKTFDYKVPMSTVMRIFLLPHKDGRQHFLVVSLDPPIKQGQTRYHFLVMSFNQDDKTSIELPFSEEELANKYEGKISKELSGPTYDVIGKIMKFLVNRKITTPSSFKGNSGTPAISCSYKAAAGYLYPLERGIIYVHKPPVYVRFEEVNCVYFARSGGSTRSFDIEIVLNSSVVHTFSSIDKGEYSNLYNFIASKKVKVKKSAGAGDKPSYVGDLEGADEEGAPDAYLERVKLEGKERDEDDEESDDESTDDDFNPDAVHESDVADEYDSNITHSDSEDGSGDSESKPKKPKEKKEKPKKVKSDKPRKRKQKDKNKPKRPPSAYMLWFNDAREKIKADNPGITFADIGKKGGELWKTVSSSVKEEYDKKVEKAKEEYAKAMKAYIESGGGKDKEDTSADETKERKPKKAKAKTATPTKTGSGAHYLSKEFIEDDTSSSDDQSSKTQPAQSDKKDTAKRKKVESSGDEKKVTKKTKEESDEGEESASTPSSSSKSESEDDSS